MTPPLTCQKSLFSIPPGERYLNSAYLGPLPNAVQAAGIEALRRRAFPDRILAPDFFEPADRVRGLCARLVNADPERVAFVPSVATAMAIVTANLTPRAGQNVVVLADQFPSNVHAWRRWRDAGVVIRTVAAPPARAADRARQWSAAVVAAIDGETAVVALEQAHWTDGTLLDLVAIGARCRAVGACLAIDATQTAGAMPLDVAAIQPDALAVHSYKSMLCGFGLGFAVFGERFADGRPIEDGWLTRAGSEDFTRLIDYRDAYAPGMRRYDTGVRANPTMIAMLEASCELLLAWQPARIRAYLLGITREFAGRVRALGFGIADEADRAANIFGLALPPGLDALACRAALAERRIHVSVRGTAIRVSPHVYNDADDLEALADALAELVHGRPRLPGAPAAVLAEA